MCNCIQGQQRDEIIAREIAMFGLALRRQRVEALKCFVDETGMAHHQPVLGHAVKKAAHQCREIILARKIIGAGEGWIEAQAGSLRLDPELGAEHVQHQRLRRRQLPRQRAFASALPHPGVRRAFLYGAQEAVAHLREKLRVLVTVDEIRRAAEQVVERVELRQHFGVDQFGIEPVHQPGAQQPRRRAGGNASSAAGTARSA
jgi:hypothetical protein